MNSVNQELKKYIDQLPSTVKIFVLGTEWGKRVDQISQKYSLTENQVASLSYEVLFVIVGMEPEEDLAGNIEKEVSVSKVLAIQLADEINSRILQYIAKMVEEKSVSKSVTPLVANVPELKPEVATPVASLTDAPHSDLLSEIETMADKVEGDTSTKIKISTPSPTPTNEQRKGAPPMNLPGEEIEMPMPIVQKTAPTSIPPEKPSSMFESKIMNPAPVSAEAKPNPVVPPQKEANPIEKSYVTDPYREPIE